MSEIVRELCLQFFDMPRVSITLYDEKSNVLRNCDTCFLCVRRFARAHHSSEISESSRFQLRESSFFRVVLTVSMGLRLEIECGSAPSSL